MGILDAVKAEIGNMDVEDLKAEYAKIQAEAAKRREKQAQYNSKPEVLAKRKEYQGKHLEALKADPAKYAKFLEARKAYMQKPETKERQKAYRQKRAAQLKAIVDRAKELGISLS